MCFPSCKNPCRCWWEFGQTVCVRILHCYLEKPGSRTAAVAPTLSAVPSGCSVQPARQNQEPAQVVMLDKSLTLGSGFQVSVFKLGMIEWSYHIGRFCG
jgi:hypothetical protein